MSYTIAVRELCEFTAKTGDLDLRFTPAPTAQEGIEGHRVVASRRGPGYQAERALQAEFGALRLRGRCDGFDPAQGLLEEVKTYRGDITRLPDNQRALHWAQAMLYGAMLCAEDGLEELAIAVVYFDIGEQKETPVTRRFTRAELQEFFEEQCTRFLRWAEQEMAHRAARDAALTALRFPHAEFRHGQRLLAKGVYRAARDGQCLMAQAPTGIGKTIGTLFPLLKALPGQQIDRVFFLTAKTPGRALALDAARLLLPDPCRSGFSPTSLPDSDAAVGLKPDLQPKEVPFSGQKPVLRVLELTARDKACVFPDKECHGDSCPLARGFYDRLPAARAAAVAEGFVDQAALQRLAAEHQICPYYLSQELARWSDVVVGDYNYYFDSSALLHALTQSRDWKVAVLCDEAHNLVDRAREMYSAELQPAALALLRKTAPAVLKRPLARLQKAWDELHHDEVPYETRDELPASFAGVLQGAIAKIADYLAEQPLAISPELLRFYFDALHFQNLLECLPLPYASSAEPPASCRSDFSPTTEGSPFLGTAASHLNAAVGLKSDLQSKEVPFPGQKPAAPHGNGAPLHSPHSFIDIVTPPPGYGVRHLRIRNVIPAPFLAPRIASAHSLTLFSATLTPHAMYRHLLGLPATTIFLDVPSPFAARQLEVRIVDRISTRYQHREASLAPIAELMAAQYRRRPGNYLAFFSSHDYLQRALGVFREAYPGIPVREQAREMSEAARAAFLQGFGTETKGIAFAVLGGAFGEGIDLPGERLIGAFVATLGLPQVNAMNEKVREVLQAQFGAGYDYTYLYPGLQKVVQAAGRVIRTQADEGVVYLIDDRFMQGKVRALLPTWWEPERFSPSPRSRGEGRGEGASTSTLPRDSSLL